MGVSIIKRSGRRPWVLGEFKSVRSGPVGSRLRGQGCGGSSLLGNGVFWISQLSLAPFLEVGRAGEVWIDTMNARMYDRGTVRVLVRGLVKGLNV